MKKKHPDNDEGRATNGLDGNSFARTQVGQGERHRRRKTTSVSPGKSLDYLYAQQSPEAGGLLMGGSWPPTGQYDEGRSNQDLGSTGEETINFGTSAPIRRIEEDDSHLVTGPLTSRPSMTESTICLSDGLPDRTDFPARSLLLESSFPVLDHEFDGHMHSDLSTFSFNQGIADRLFSNDMMQPQDGWSPTGSQTSHGCHLFFTHVSHFVPFLHRPTFHCAQLPRHLVLSMLCLAYQHGEDPDCQGEAGSGVNLSIRCFHQACVLIAAFDEERTDDDQTQHIVMVQSYLLLQICAMMYLCGKDSAHGLKLHSKAISLARAGGLMQPLSVEPAVTGDLETLWQEFIKTESHKRTLFAMHQIDALWYQFLSTPRSLSHLEIKHDLPCLDKYWTASSAAEWAHSQLVARNPGSLMPYADAVRRFLSPNADLSSIPTFDPYGAINIAQFLVSSAREVSGWSTMTGMLSIERSEPLKASLIALKPFLSPLAETARTTRHGAAAVLCEATWETAMLELQMWSPSHVGGIVQGSMDAVLQQSTYLAPASSGFVCESEIARAAQPHVDWFLRYLDTTIAPESEAPWVTLYAYKAFLIAWQLVRGKTPGAMQVVSVRDGDVDGALAWARKVFQHRQRWKLGRLIMPCLESLGK